MITEGPKPIKKLFLDGYIRRVSLQFSLDLSLLLELPQTLLLGP